MVSIKQWIALAVRLGIVMGLTVPLAIGFQIGGILLTGWGVQGFAWLAVGISWLPTALASMLHWFETRNLRQSIWRGILMGIVASLALFLLGFLLLVIAGPMDGGI